MSDRALAMLRLLLAAKTAAAVPDQNPNPLMQTMTDVSHASTPAEVVRAVNPSALPPVTQPAPAQPSLLDRAKTEVSEIGHKLAPIGGQAMDYLKGFNQNPMNWDRAHIGGAVGAGGAALALAYLLSKRKQHKTAASLFQRGINSLMHDDGEAFGTLHNAAGDVVRRTGAGTARTAREMPRAGEPLDVTGVPQLPIKPLSPKPSVVGSGSVPVTPPPPAEPPVPPTANAPVPGSPGPEDKPSMSNRLGQLVGRLRARMPAVRMPSAKTITQAGTGAAAGALAAHEVAQHSALDQALGAQHPAPEAQSTLGQMGDAASNFFGGFKGNPFTQWDGAHQLLGGAGALGLLALLLHRNRRSDDE